MASTDKLLALAQEHQWTISQGPGGFRIDDVDAAVFGAAAFAAGGAALGAGAREVRAATLAAVMICLPVALLSLVPDDAVGPAIEALISVVTAAFPFRPALDALTAGLDLTGPSMWLPMLHLALLTVIYGALARLALKRF